MSTPSAHSLFSASSSSRWLRCPGSLAMTQHAPRRTNAAARRGTAAHEVVSALLKGPDTEDAYSAALGQRVAVEGDLIEIDEELARQVETYVAYVRGFSGVRLVEVRSLYGPVIGIDSELAWGTADAVVMQDDDTVHVIDFKTGRVWQQAEGNTQLLLYAAGVVHHLTEAGVPPSRVVLHIVQPVVHETPSTWELTMDAFNAEAAKLKAKAAHAQTASESFTDEHDTQWVASNLSPSEEACRWCPAAAACPALAQIVPDDLTTAYVPMLTAAGLNHAFSRLGLIETYVSAIREEAYKRATRGEAGLAFKLVLGREGNRKFGDTEQALAGLRALGLTEQQLMAEPALKSPAAIEKELKAMKRKDLIEAMATWTIRPPAKPALADAGDPRPAWTEGNVAEEFAVIG